MNGTSFLKRGVLITAGSLSLGVAVIGIFLPLLPATPFLLISAACYVRSSDRLYRWLLANPVTSSYISNFRAGKGIPARAKAASIGFLWITLAVSRLDGPNLVDLDHPGRRGCGCPAFYPLSANPLEVRGPSTDCRRGSAQRDVQHSSYGDQHHFVFGLRGYQFSDFLRVGTSLNLWGLTFRVERERLALDNTPRGGHLA